MFNMSQLMAATGAFFVYGATLPCRVDFAPGFIMSDNGFRGFGHKPSGVAASKRAAAKRNNIRKHSR